MDSMIKIGPVGRTYSRDQAGIWDEKGNSRIVQIFIWYDDYRVCSLQFQYVSANGTLVVSERHGTEIASQFAAVKLSRTPNEEYLTRITGYYGGEDIASLKFITNRGEYGPYGPTPADRFRAQHTWDDSCDDYFEVYDKAFSFDLGKNRFGGFHGIVRNDGKLGALGVYVDANAVPEAASALALLH